MNEMNVGVTEIISKVTSASSAKRILDEIAVAGNYIASGISDGFVIYSRIADDFTEEITARKQGDRTFVITKTTTIEAENGS